MKKSKNSKEITEISFTNRIKLIVIWAIIVLLSVFFTLLIGMLFLGDKAGSDLIVGNIYTFIPGIIAIIFILRAKTDSLDSLWKQFEFPRIKWVLFGLGYTLVVLFLTIITGIILGELTYNDNYSPFTEDLTSLKTYNPLSDILIYVLFVGVLLIFSPGGFIRVIGEEVGWRGYLMPECIKLHPKVSLLVSSIFIGFVWFIYHLPYFTFLAPVSPKYLLFFVIGSVGVFFGANWAMMWAYLKTKSLWPSLSLHFLWNLISPLFTGNIYSKTPGLLNPSLDNIWLVNGEGLIGGFFHFLVGIIFLILILRNKDELLSNYEKLGESHSFKTNLKRMKMVTQSKK